MAGSKKVLLDQAFQDSTETFIIEEANQASSRAFNSLIDNAHAFDSFFIWLS